MVRDVFENGNKGRVKRAAPGIIHHYPCHYHPPISSIRIGDYKLMRHLSSGEVRLYNVKTDYREEQDLASSMPEKAAAMDAVRQRYIDEVNGGRIEDVYRALYETMDEFSERSRDGFRKDLAKLKVQKPADFEAKKKKLLEKLNESLMKHEITKERTRIYSKMNTWRKHSPKSEAEKVVMRNWTNVTE